MEEVSAAACDDKSDRVELAQLYNEVDATVRCHVHAQTFILLLDFHLFSCLSDVQIYRW